MLTRSLSSGVETSWVMVSDMFLYIFLWCVVLGENRATVGVGRISSHFIAGADVYFLLIALSTYWWWESGRKIAGEKERERECCRQHMLLSWQRVSSPMSFCVWISFYIRLQRRRVQILLLEQIRNTVILRKMIRSLVSLSFNLFATCWARTWVDWGVEWSRAETFVFWFPWDSVWDKIQVLQPFAT